MNPKRKTMCEDYMNIELEGCNHMVNKKIKKKKNQLLSTRLIWHEFGATMTRIFVIPYLQCN